jgi:translation initiation factor IF-3
MHPRHGEFFDSFGWFVGAEAAIEREPKVEGRNMVMILTPTITKHD